MAKKKEETAAAAEKSAAIQARNEETIKRPDRVENAHGERAEQSYAGAKCFVGFKVGIAYFDMQLSRLEEVDEQTQTGLRRVKVPIRFGPVVRIRGTAYPRGVVPKGFPPPPEMVEGAAINPGVDKDFMLEWLKLNKLNPIVQNNMIFIADTEQDIRAMARGIAGVTSGFEPIDPTDPKDPRRAQFKSTNRDVGDLTPGER